MVGASSAGAAAVRGAGTLTDRPDPSAAASSAAGAGVAGAGAVVAGEPSVAAAGPGGGTGGAVATGPAGPSPAGPAARRAGAPPAAPGAVSPLVGTRGRKSAYPRVPSGTWTGMAQPGSPSRPGHLIAGGSPSWAGTVNRYGTPAGGLPPGECEVGSGSDTYAP
ncbi:hypothetical protein TPA0907_43600 [Micromonospora humidisoli]|nr:hypothetical protein TPA0907_43600 [Micromonospora sp. AKA109]